MREIQIVCNVWFTINDWWYVKKIIAFIYFQFELLEMQPLKRSVNKWVKVDNNKISFQAIRIFIFSDLGLGFWDYGIQIKLNWTD